MLRTSLLRPIYNTRVLLCTTPKPSIEEELKRISEELRDIKQTIKGESLDLYILILGMSFIVILGRPLSK